MPLRTMDFMQCAFDSLIGGRSPEPECIFRKVVLRTPGIQQDLTIFSTENGANQEGTLKGDPTTHIVRSP